MKKKAGAQATPAEAYAQAGVDIARDERFVETIKNIARTTSRAEVVSPIGGFAGLFRTPTRYQDPLLVACADGVGTKLKLAEEIGQYETIGIDCVAMVVNDLIVQGAEPLVFLDYLAMGELDEEIAATTLRGVAEGCKRAGCALLGGESANMPGMYRGSEVELVGFGVGVVEREAVINTSDVRKDDVLIGIASSGLHSNGFSLVRRIIDRNKLNLHEMQPELNNTLAATLLAPTHIYVKPVLNLLRDFNIHGIAHITGGGFEGNVPRVLPESAGARIDLGAWKRPPIFDWLKREGEIEESEMLRVFNCGLGMVLVVSKNDVEEVLQRLAAMGERAWTIGATFEQEEGGPKLVFEGAAAASGEA